MKRLYFDKALGGGSDGPLFGLVILFWFGVSVALFLLSTGCGGSPEETITYSPPMSPDEQKCLSWEADCEGSVSCAAFRKCYEGGSFPTGVVDHVHYCETVPGGATGCDLYGGMLAACGKTPLTHSCFY